jgi:hypothetical protein
MNRMQEIGGDTMKKRVLLALTTVAFMLACGAAFAEESPDIRSHDGHSMRGRVGMMGCGMMARGGIWVAVA